MKKIILGLILISILSGCNTNIVEDETTLVETTTIVETTTVAETTTVEETTTAPETLAERENTDFRNVCWGDDLKIVKRYEKSKAVIGNSFSSESIIYEDKLLSYDTYIVYRFKDMKLYGAGYLLNEKYTNSGQYIVQYENIKSALKEIYGEPIEDLIAPLEKQSLIDLAGPATALRNGYVAYRTKWETETTNITLGMSSQNFEVGVLVDYKDKNYKEDVSGSGL